MGVALFCEDLKCLKNYEGSSKHQADFESLLQKAVETASSRKHF